MVVVLAAGAAHADGVVEARTIYYKETSTRVVQPMLDGMFDAGARGAVDAHLLVDAVSSASAGAGTGNAQVFSKQRYEAGGGYTHEWDGADWVDKLRLRGEGRASDEPDYRSFYAGGRAEADLAQKNASIGLGGGIMHDKRDLTDRESALNDLKIQCEGEATANSVSCPLLTYMASASYSQIVSKNAVVGATYDFAYLDGYQANPYRTALTATGLVSEKHPFTRVRNAVAVSGRYYISDTETTVIAGYRYYHDDWQITAHTPELRIVQQAGRDIDATLAYRYYWQSASFFYETKYPDPETMPLLYYTGDPKMSAFDSHLIEGKLGVLGHAFDLDGVWSRARFEAILEYVVQHNAFGNAGVAHVAVTVPFDY
ncbi:MAG TPA: DUF3570 domain-containing protein [Kofleriaceae bacterium]|nr:DUF3570 domain-containing protein [Kofleriaceae bacterium]